MRTINYPGYSKVYYDARYDCKTETAYIFHWLFNGFLFCFMVKSTSVR